MKSSHIVIAGVAAVLVAAFLLSFMRGDEDSWICEQGVWTRHGNPSTPIPQTGCGEPQTPAAEVKSFADCAAAGNTIMESYPRQCRTQEGQTFTEEVQIAEKKDLIRVFEPKPNQTVTSPFLVRGEARGNWFFEASFPIELRSEDGRAIASGIAQADAPWMTTEFVPFHVLLEYKAENLPQLAALVLHKDNPSGLPEHDDQLEFPITLDQAVFAGGPMTVKVFFGNSQKDPSVEDCGKVWAVVRTVGSVEVDGTERDRIKILRTLEELMKGPTNREQQEGYFSSINFGAAVKDITVSNGTATVDFDEKMEEGMGGSCRVTAIRAQIEQTLKQFPAIESVIISVNGRTEDILQP